MIANGDSNFGAPSDWKSLRRIFETFKKDSWRPLEEHAREQMHVQLYLEEEAVLHRLGKARTEWRKAVRSRRVSRVQTQLFEAESYYCFKILQDLIKLPCTRKEAGYSYVIRSDMLTPNIQ